MKTPSSRVPAALQLGLAESDQRLTTEAAAEEQDAGGILARKKGQRFVQLATGAGQVAQLSGEQSEVQVRHRKGGIQVDGGRVVLGGREVVSAAFLAKGQQVMRAWRKLVSLQQQPARGLGAGQVATVCECNGLEQQDIGVCRLRR